MTKKFFFVCAGLLCLAVAYHLGATNAQGQAGSAVTGIAVGLTGNQAASNFYVMTQDGTVYWRQFQHFNPSFAGAPFQSAGNFWTGSSPTASQSLSWGSLKARYR